jgi:hypothetical protein
MVEVAMPDSTEPAIAEGDDPIIAMVNARLEAIEAAVPRDLTRITANDPPLGLECLILTSMKGDPGPAEPPIEGAIPNNTATVSGPSADTVRFTMHEMVDGQMSADVIAIAIDKATRTVALAAVPVDLAQIGGVGAAVTAINGNAPYVFLEGGLPTGEVLWWDVAVGKRTIRLALIFKDESGAPAGPASASGFILPDSTGSSDNPVELAVHAANWSRHDSGDYPQPERVRPPRPTAVSWDPFREFDDPYWWDRRPAPRPVFKQTCPLYDRRR